MTLSKVLVTEATTRHEKEGRKEGRKERRLLVDNNNPQNTPLPDAAG